MRSPECDDVIEFIVEGSPPAYDPGYSIFNPEHPHYFRVKKLRDQARNAMKGRGPLEGDVLLEIEHEVSGGWCRADSVNIIGGIANALEGIVYWNDSQIKEVHYKQILSTRNLYRIRIRSLF